MKLKFLAGTLFAGAALLSTPAFAQSSANATGSAKIIRPVAITNSTGLAFGTLIRPSTGTDTVTILNSADSVSGATTVAGSSVSRAKFAIAGEGGQSVSVTVPASFELARVGGSPTEKLVVTLSSDVSGSTTLGGALGDTADGTKAVNVGGSFPLASNTATGNYSGTFTVSVAYP